MACQLCNNLFKMLEEGVPDCKTYFTDFFLSKIRGMCAFKKYDLKGKIFAPKEAMDLQNRSFVKDLSSIVGHGSEGGDGLQDNQTSSGGNRNYSLSDIPSYDNLKTKYDSVISELGRKAQSLREPYNDNSNQAEDVNNNDNYFDYGEWQPLVHWPGCEPVLDCNEEMVEFLNGNPAPEAYRLPQNAVIHHEEGWITKFGTLSPEQIFIGSLEDNRFVIFRKKDPIFCKVFFHL